MGERLISLNALISRQEELMGTSAEWAGIAHLLYIIRRMDVTGDKTLAEYFAHEEQIAGDGKILSRIDKAIIRDLCRRWIEVVGADGESIDEILAEVSKDRENAGVTRITPWSVVTSVDSN